MSQSQFTTLYRVAGRLALISLVCGLGLVTVHLITSDTIEINIEQYAQRQLHDVIGADVDSKRVSLTKQSEVLYFYKKIVDSQQSNVPAAVPRTDPRTENGRIEQILTNQGYNGDITFWLATSNAGFVKGVRVISHSETPGLGDKFDLSISDWVLDFNNRSLENTSWDVKKHGGDFDAFTGATITPRAIIYAVAKHLELRLKTGSSQNTQEASEENKIDGT